MKTNKINEKRYEKGLSLIVSFCKNLAQWVSRGSLVGRPWVSRGSSVGRATFQHRASGLLKECRSSVDRVSIEPRCNSAKNANVQMCKIALLQFCKIGKANFAQLTTNYFARVAAMLLMLVTMSVGQVWGKTLYLHTGGSSLWNQASATFWVHAWGAGDTDKKMTLANGDVYSVDVPDGTTGIIFLREKSDATGVVWKNEDGMWNKTGDLQVPNDGKNLFRMTAWGNGSWETKSISVGLDKNGGSNSNGNPTINYGTSTLSSFVAGVKDGYTFTGYYSAKSGGVKVINADGTLVAGVSEWTDANGNWIKYSDSKITVYAQYEQAGPTQYVIAGNGFGNWLGGSSWSNDAVANLMDYNAGTWSKTYTSVAAGTYKFKLCEKGTWNGIQANTAGKTLTGVNTTPADDGTNNHNIQFTTIAAGDITITYDGTTVSVTAPAQRYTVTYAAGTGASGTMTDSNSPYVAGAQVTLLSSTFTAPTGKQFASWSVKDASDNTVAVTDGKFTMPSSNVTVTAQWEDVAPAPGPGGEETFKTTGEGSSDSEVKDIDNVLTAGTIPATYIAGINSTTGLKLRTDRSTANTRNGLQINVHSGYTVTKVVIANSYLNSSSNTRAITNVYVDGIRSNSWTSQNIGENSSNKTTITLDNINATNKIEFEFDFSVQYRADITITYTSSSEPTTYSITYNCDGATSGCPANLTEQTNLPDPLPEAPFKLAYKFLGWYTNSLKTEAAVAGAAISENTTLYVKWSSFMQTNVTFNKNGGTGGQGNNTIKYGANEKPAGWTAPTKDGATFDGYWDGEGGTGTKYFNADGTAAKVWDIEASSVTLYAKWNAITYMVTVNDPETSCDKNVSASAGQTVTITNSCSAPGKHLTGYTAKKTSDDSNVVLENAAGTTTFSFTMPAYNVTLTAVWEEEDLTTVWKLNIWVDGTLEWQQYDFTKAAGHSAESVASYSLDLNAGEHDFELLKDGTTYYKNSGTMNSGNCTNWTFTTSADRGKINCNVTGNYTFTINFAESNPKVSVTYPAAYSGLNVHRSNSNAADPAAISANIVAQGQSVTVTAQAAKAGYAWSGWTSENGTFGDAGALMTTFTPTANNAIAQANYTANTYSVAFDANGGTGSMENQAFTYGEAAKALTSNSFTRTGFAFAGWNTAADGSGDNYTNGQSVQNLTTEADRTVTLYAKWTANNPGEVTVTGDYHHFVGETMTLTATAANTLAAAGVTYTWKKGGDVVAGQTSATLSIPSCTFDNAGNYTCTIDNNGASATSAGYEVKILKFWLKNNSGADISDHTFTKVNATTATVSVYMDENTTYKWSMVDGVGGNYGHNGTMTEGNAGPLALNCNCNTTINATTSGYYLFTLDYSGMPNYTMSVTYPDPNQQAGHKIYFDNSVPQWSESSIYYRIGRADHVNTPQQLTKVPGTQNLFVTTTLEYNNFLAWHIANAAGTSGSGKNIYDTKTDAITYSSEYQKSPASADVTIQPTGEPVIGARTENNNCYFYGGSRHNGLLTHTATVGAHVGGTIKFTYTDIEGVEHVDVTETTAGLAHTCILTITAEASTGYTLSGVTVNGDPFTNGGTHVLSEDATIAAVITANQYNITYKDQGDADFSGTGWETTQPTTHTYGTATTLVKPTKASSIFLGWYETPDCLGAPVTTIGATSITADKTLYAKWADYCFAMVVKNPSSTNKTVNLSTGNDLTTLMGGSVSENGLDENTKDKGLKFGHNADYIEVTLDNEMQLGKNTRILVSFETTNAAQNGITFGTEIGRPKVDDSNSILMEAIGTYELEEFVVSQESPLFEATTFYIYRAGGNGTYLTAVYVVDCSKICRDQAPKIVEESHATGCSPNYVVKAVDQSGNDLNTGSFQWYKDEVAIQDATSQTYTITEDGSYTVEYTNSCPVFSSNSFEVENLKPSVQKLVPFQYYHVDSTYIAGDARHLFTYNSVNYQVVAVRNVDTPYEIPTGAVYRKAGTDGVDTLMLNRALLNNLTLGDSLTITATPVDGCSHAYSENAASVKVYAIAKATKTLAFILPGANSPTKYKKFFVLDGDFLTGYNKADLYLQNNEATNANQKAGVLCYDPDTELPLYTALKENFLVTPVNGYAKFNIFNYEPFDLLFLTDFVKTDGSNDAAAAKRHVEDLGLLVDYRPMFSTKAHMSGFNNWKDKGFTANPVAPKQPQLHMNIVCYAHPMFEDMIPDGDGFYNDALDPNETVFQMLSQGGYDSNKGIQGFEMTGANEFIKIALTHYDAHGDVNGIEITPVPGANDRTLIASCERQENINARFMILSLNADATCFLTARGREVIIRSLKYLLETRPTKVTDCHFDFVNEGGVGFNQVTYAAAGGTGTPGDGKWSTAANWAPRHSVLPTKNVDVRISANCRVDNTIAVAANVKVKDGYVLTIADNAALQIQGIAQHVSNEGVLSPTSPSDLVVSGSSTGTGAFIHGDKTGQTGATVEMYSIASGTDNGKGGLTNAQWQWMTTPYNDVYDVQNNYYGAWMYAYNNVTHAWDPKVVNGSSMQPFGGYSITQLNPKTYTMTGTLVSTSDKAVPLYEGINLIGNSWTAPIDITKMSDGDFVNADATIVMFNTGLDEDGSGDVHPGVDTDSRTAGTYVSIPVNTAGEWADALKVIPAMQAFQVKANGSGSLKLDYDKMVRGTDAVNIQPLRAPGRRTVATNDTDNGIDERLRIVVRGSRYSDFLYLFRNPETTMGFDNGWDGEKVYSDNYDIPAFYVENAVGDWQVSTQPELAGTTFGFYKGEDTQYTVSFEYNGDEKLWFYDAATGIYTAVETGNIYSFTSTFVSDDPERRFVLTNYNPNAPQNPGVATGVDDVSPDGGPRKLILNDKLFILNNGRLYDATGRLAY